MYLINVFKCIFSTSICSSVFSVCLNLKELCFTHGYHYSIWIVQKNGVRHNAQIAGLIHAHCQAFLQHKTASALQCLPLPWCASILLYLHTSEVRWEQLSKTTLSRVAFPRTGSEYSHDLFWNHFCFETEDLLSVQDKPYNSVWMLMRRPRRREGATKMTKRGKENIIHFYDSTYGQQRRVLVLHHQH